MVNKALYLNQINSYEKKIDLPIDGIFSIKCKFFVGAIENISA